MSAVVRGTEEGWGKWRASLRNVSSLWGHLYNTMQIPFWAEPPPHPYDTESTISPSCPRCPPGRAGCQVSEVLFPARSPLLRGLTSSSRVAPDGLSPLSRGLYLTARTVHPKHSRTREPHASLALLHPTLSPQVLSLLLPPLRWSLQAGLPAPLCG